MKEPVSLSFDLSTLSERFTNCENVILVKIRNKNVEYFTLQRYNFDSTRWMNLLNTSQVNIPAT
jgi:hypothetical protein